MRVPRELRSSVTLAHLVLVVTAALLFTAGFSVIEGWPLDQSFYFVILLMTLVGANISPLTPAGLVLASALAILSVGIIVSFIAQVLGPLSLRVYRTNLRSWRLSRMKNHVIICGYSDTAKALANRLPKADLLAIVKDQDTSDHLAAQGIAVVLGDYTTADVLRRAGVAESRAVIAVSPMDAENAFVCLTAKKIAPRVPVIATVTSEENQEKLNEVGADRIISPALLCADSIVRALGSPGA